MLIQLTRLIQDVYVFSWILGPDAFDCMFFNPTGVPVILADLYIVFVRQRRLGFQLFRTFYKGIPVVQHIL